MLKYWLVSDDIAHEFAFKMNGFDYLLDKILGGTSKWVVEMIEEEKSE